MNTKPIYPVTQFFITDSLIPIGFNIGVTNDTLVSQFGGFMTLPSSEVSGVCSDSNFVKFGRNVPDNSCTRRISSSTLQNDCSTIYSIDYMIRRLRVGRAPVSSLFDAESFRSVKINSISSLSGTRLDSSITSTCK